MMTGMDRLVCPWCQAARTTTLVGAAFSAIFAVLLAVNLVGSAVIGPWRENRLAALKVQVQKEPGNQQLLSEIRQLDLKVRHDRLWRWSLPIRQRTCCSPVSWFSWWQAN